MHVYSGECEHGECGIPAGFKDAYGQDLFVGDIVISHNERGTVTGLSVIVDDRPDLLGHEEKEQPFVMGLRNADFEPGGWVLKKIKHWAECIHGEHWKDYGFNYRT